MKVVNVTFGQAVRMPNKKQENFITADQYTTLEFDKELDGVIISQKDYEAKIIVFKTNISHLTFKEESKAKKTESK